MVIYSFIIGFIKVKWILFIIMVFFFELIFERFINLGFKFIFLFDIIKIVIDEIIKGLFFFLCLFNYGMVNVVKIFLRSCFIDID